jgi:hypothetical protein
MVFVPHLQVDNATPRLKPLEEGREKPAGCLPRRLKWQTGAFASRLSEFLCGSIVT